MGIGFTFPFSPATGSLGLFEMSNDIVTAAGHDIRSLVGTNWGERVMRYHFGADLRRLIFDQSDNDLREKIVDRIIDQVGRWLPTVHIGDVAVVLGGESPNVPTNSVHVRISYAVNGDPSLAGSVSLTVP